METIELFAKIAPTIIAILSTTVAVWQAGKHCYSAYSWVKKNIFDRLENHEERITKLEGDDETATAS